MIVEILYRDGCPSYAELLPRVRELIQRERPDATLRLVAIADQQAAVRERFPGSPTVRVDGHDIEPGSEQRGDFGLACRLYRVQAGLRATPPEQWLLDALRS